MATAASDQYRDVERVVLVSDLDGTLIDPRLRSGDPHPHLRTLGDVLADPEGRLELWFNSSRPVASQLESLRLIPDLPRPRYQIGAMGTQVADGRTGELLPAFGREQFGEWPRDDVERVCVEVFGLMPHAADMQTRYKASFDLPDPLVARAVEGELASRGVECRLIVSSGRDLDVLPPTAGKATAIRWLADRQCLSPSCVVVAGDSANDLDMFAEPFRGIVPANGHDELKRQAPKRCAHVYEAEASFAEGVLEGLRHYGIRGV